MVQVMLQELKQAATVEAMGEATEEVKGEAKGAWWVGRAEVKSARCRVSPNTNKAAETEAVPWPE